MIPIGSCMTHSILADSSEIAGVSLQSRHRRRRRRKQIQKEHNLPPPAEGEIDLQTFMAMMSHLLDDAQLVRVLSLLSARSSLLSLHSLLAPFPWLFSLLSLLSPLFSPLSSSSHLLSGRVLSTPPEHPIRSQHADGPAGLFVRAFSGQKRGGGDDQHHAAAPGALPLPCHCLATDLPLPFTDLSMPATPSILRAHEGHSVLTERSEPQSEVIRAIYIVLTRHAAAAGFDHRGRRALLQPAGQDALGANHPLRIPKLLSPVPKPTYAAPLETSLSIHRPTSFLREVCWDPWDLLNHFHCLLVASHRLSLICHWRRRNLSTAELRLKLLSEGCQLLPAQRQRQGRRLARSVAERTERSNSSAAAARGGGVDGGGPMMTSGTIGDPQDDSYSQVRHCLSLAFAPLPLLLERTAFQQVRHCLSFAFAPLPVLL